jgi:glycosyltransferase involved in cell wall biosynthesis
MKLKILINSLAGGGAERQIALLSEQIPIDEIIILENEIAYKLSNTKITSLSKVNKKQSSLVKTLLIPVYAARLNKIIEQNDIIVSFLERSNFVNIVCRLLFKKKDVKVIVNERNTPSLAFKKGLKRLNIFLLKKLYPHADLILGNSIGVKVDLLALCKVPGNKIKVINNACDSKYITSRSKEKIDAKYEPIFTDPVIINIGSFKESKGQWHLIRIFAGLKSEFSNIKLVILGDGKLRNYLTGLAGQAGLRVYSIWDQKSEESNNIEDYDIYFLGFQENPFSILKRSSVFILPSLWEGFPNVLLEAMAVGLPVLAADCQSGPREMLSSSQQQNKENSGILLPVLDNKYYSADEPLTAEEKIWQAAIQEMLSNKKRRKEYAVKSKERAMDFDPQRIAAEWKEVLKTI